MKDDRVYFEHILLCIEKIEDYTKMDRSLYMESTIIQDAWFVICKFLRSLQRGYLTE